jgi:hypothetical protein
MGIDLVQLVKILWLLKRERERESEKEERK